MVGIFGHNLIKYPRHLNTVLSGLYCQLTALNLHYRIVRSSLSKSKYFDGIVPSIFDLIKHRYLSSWGHSRVVIANK